MAVWWASVAGLAVVLCLLAPDVAYFLRFGAMAVRALYLSPRVHLLQTTRYRGRCTVADCDPGLRCMRPSRYWRQLDFARYHFYMRCGLFSEITLRRGGVILQGACSFRHCRRIPARRAYRIETQLVHWGEKCVYLRQRFVTEEDGATCAECLSKQSVTGASVEEAVRSAAGGLVRRPRMELELEQWIRSMEASSCKLRAAELSTSPT